MVDYSDDTRSYTPVSGDSECLRICKANCLPESLDHIDISSEPALERQGRRLSDDELDLLLAARNRTRQDRNSENVRGRYNGDSNFRSRRGAVRRTGNDSRHDRRQVLPFGCEATALMAADESRGFSKNLLLLRFIFAFQIARALCGESASRSTRKPEGYRGNWQILTPKLHISEFHTRFDQMIGMDHVS